MPVSKKRKKDGKPVQKKAPAAAAAEHAHGPEAKAAAPVRTSKPANPFVAQQQQSRRGAQRGR